MKPALLLLGLLLVTINLFVNDVQAQNTWTYKTFHPSGFVQAPIDFVINGIAYICKTSGNPPNLSATTELWAYNPVTGDWTQKASMPQYNLFAGSVAFSIGGIGYVTTGSDATIGVIKKLYAYDPLSNSWTQKSDFPGVARSGAVGFVIGGKGYVGLGSSNSFTRHTDFYEYNPATDTWTQKASYPYDRRGVSSFVLGSIGYVVGGTDETDYYDDLLAYDPVTNNWSHKADFAGGPKTGLVTFEIGNRGFVGMGTEPGFSSKRFYEYDPYGDTWKRLADFQDNRSNAVGFSVGNKGYVGFGYFPITFYLTENSLYEYEPAPYVSAGPSITVCSNTATQLAGLPSGGTWSGPGMNSSGTFTPAVAGNGTFTVTYSINSGGQPYSATTKVTVIASPSVAATAANPALCVGQSTMLSATGASSYSWNTGQATAAFSVSPSSSTTYTVTGTAANGCTNTSSVSVTVNPYPVISASSAQAVICSGQSTNLSASGASSYSWNTGQTTSNISISPASSTTYTVTGSNGGCSTAATVSVAVNPSPVVNISANPAAICAGQSTSLSATGASLYSWSAGQSSANISVSPAVSTTYTVTGTSNGCSGSATRLVSVVPLPVVTALASPSAICSGQTASLTAVGASAYSWSTGQSGATISATPTSNTTYSVIGTSNGCSSTATVGVTVNAAPTAIVLSSNSPLCEGEDLQLSAIAAGTSLSWSGPASFNSALSSPIIASASQTNSGTYTVTATNAFGCSSQNTLAVIVAPLPDSTFTSTGSGTTHTFTANGTGTYVWNFPGGTPANSTAQSPTVTFSGQSSYIISLTITNASGCSATSSQVLTITGEGEDLQTALFKVFPNPASHTIQIDFDLPSGASRAKLLIQDALGRYSKDILLSGQSGNYIIDIDNYPAALYFYRLSVSDKVLQTGKFVKQ